MAATLDPREQRINELELLISNLQAEKVHLQSRIDNPPTAGLWRLGKDKNYYREELHTINAILSEWAKDFATTTAAPWQDLPEYERWHFINNILSTVTKVKDGKAPKGLMDDEGTMLFLDALVAHHMYKNIFARPFFCAPDRRIASLGGELSWVYIELLKGDQVAAHKWRYETLRLLSPLDDQNLYAQTRALLKQAAKDEVVLFLGSTINCLVNMNRKNESHRRLVEIFEIASWRAYDIWCEKEYIRCTTIKEFGEMTFEEGDRRWTADDLRNLKEIVGVVKGDEDMLFTRPWLELVDLVVEENAGRDKQLFSRVQFQINEQNVN
ncbi:hypothetical protein BDZ45DRAFT_748691 [Acephala macrosclerotiorum]|nr:hypothetical protein BDZ45DRAFT_748691 [Acephala macrosclerotiorum]